jgi:hypothetical protein
MGRCRTIVRADPPIIAAVGEALGSLIQGVERQVASRTALDKACEKRELENTASTVEAEIQRRSNGPGQRRLLIKQLASEYGLPAYELQAIISVYRKEQKAKRPSRQELRVLAPRLQGFSHREIA